MHVVSPYVEKVAESDWLSKFMLWLRLFPVWLIFCWGGWKYISPCWSSLEWQLFSLHVSSGFCTPWEALYVMRDSCCSFVSWTVDMVSKGVGKALVTWLQQYYIHISSTHTQTWRELSPSCVPPMPTIQLQTGCLCFIPLSLPPSLLPPRVGNVLDPTSTGTILTRARTHWLLTLGTTNSYKPMDDL